MKNPFVKERHNGLIAGLILGSVAAAAVTYLLVTEKGASLRQDLADSFSRLHNTVFGGQEQEQEVENNAHDYLEKPHKAPKTDREALLHNQILSHTGGTQAS
jgi:gas vesicle protein